jgi:hypothetical protein
VTASPTTSSTVLTSRAAPPPYDARDLHPLDDIVDYTEQTADWLGLYGVEAPMAQAEDLSDVLTRATVAVEAALADLHAGDDLSVHLVEIHQLENDGDRLSRDAIASLFNGIDPMVVIRWKDICESLEQAIDSCETVAHLLEIPARRAARTAVAEMRVPLDEGAAAREKHGIELAGGRPVCTAIAFRSACRVAADDLAPAPR